jgi:hypothetical protein
MEKQFIIWDPKDGRPFREDGGIISDGCIGRIGLDNAYLTAYGERERGSKPYNELEVGESVLNVTFRLSGQKGVYDIYRVR